MLLSESERANADLSPGSHKPAENGGVRTRDSGSFSLAQVLGRPRSPNLSFTCLQTELPCSFLSFTSTSFSLPRCPFCASSARHNLPMSPSDYAPLDVYDKARYHYDSHSIDAKIVVMGNTGRFIILYPANGASLLICGLTPCIGVGKTSLLQRYTQNKFDPRNTTSTTGAFFVTKKIYVDGLKVRLQLWDTAGQERFRSMVRANSRAERSAEVVKLIARLTVLPSCPP